MADPRDTAGPADPTATATGSGPGGLQDALRKALLTGMGALFLTEEGMRRLAREWKLPKDVTGFIGAQASGAKEELLRVFSEEVRRFFESETVRRELLKSLAETVIEIKAEVRVRPDERGEPRPEVKAEVGTRAERGEDE
jgi:hypothetical protein